MDHIYPTKDYKVYNIKDEVEKLKASVVASEMPLEFNEIATKVGISFEKLMETSLDICSSFEDFGTDQPSDSSPPFSSFPSEALELNVVKTIREGNFVFKEPRVKEVTKFPVKSGENPLVQSNLKIFEESVVTIRFYEPFQYTPSMKNQPRFHQEYHVLGSNLLTDLRDKFYCHCNNGPFFDISDDPHKELKIKS